ncbi:MAG TPA: 16S rRNA (guanine(966)-N(2))-methyltransferase RsmD [Spirochaetota bacterium]|nr:16S rRNA (guanine(966)-N(2))-methyltransferase RsmD [Spirochaetota bacterium]
MKILSGHLKNRSIKYHFQNKPRPTTAKTREAVFDIISDRIKHAAFLDIFSGSGAVGMEAFSRGAAKIFFIENDYLLVKSLKENIVKLKINGVVLNGDYKINLINLRRMKQQFDIIYIDPPYFSQNIISTLKNCFKNKLFRHNTLFITEYHKKESCLVQQIPDMFALVSLARRSYGISTVEFFKQRY